MTIRLTESDLDLTLFQMRRMSTLVEGIPIHAQELVPDVGCIIWLGFFQTSVARGTKALCRPRYARQSCRMSGT